MFSKREKGDEIKAFLGKGAEFTGKLIFNGTVRIDGDFSGEIFGEGTLVVGDGAHIEADVNVTSIIISGDIHGQIECKERIEIYAPGRVFGSVKTPRFIMKEGAIFEGTSKMDSIKSEEYTVNSKSKALNAKD